MPPSVVNDTLGTIFDELLEMLLNKATGTQLGRIAMRKPLELPMHRENGCVTSILGQVLYVFGHVDAPNLHEIDRLAGCQPNDGLNDHDAYRVLLQAGFCLYQFSDFRPDLFAARGLDYLRAYYADEWGRTHEAFFTRGRVATDQYRASCFWKRQRRGRAATSLSIGNQR